MNQSAILKKDLSKTVKRLLRKHNEVVVYFRDSEGLKKRLISKDGLCKVSYKGYHYSRWTRYNISCFLYDYVERQVYRKSKNWNYIEYGILSKYKKYISLNRTLKELIKHDKLDRVDPVQISYGKKLKNKIYIVSPIK